MEKRICTLYQVINIFNLATYGGNASKPLVSTLNIKEFVDTYEHPVRTYDDNGNVIKEEKQKIALNEDIFMVQDYRSICEFYGKDLVFTIKYSEKTGRYTIKNNINKLTTSTNFDANIPNAIVDLLNKIYRDTDFSNDREIKERMKIIELKDNIKTICEYAITKGENTDWDKVIKSIHISEGTYNEEKGFKKMAD